MNRAKIDKEKKNVKLLFQYFTHYGFQHGFWTLAGGLCFRLKIQKAYKYADKKRYEICKNYLRKQYSDFIAKTKFNTWVFWWQGEQRLPYLVDLLY